MAIENNYEGPPSLEIYQDFVQSAAIGEIDQNVVIVAPHYDVFKASEATDTKLFKQYDAGSELNLKFPEGTRYADIDTKSVNVMFTDAMVEQGNKNGSLVYSDNGTVIDVESDITIPKLSGMPMPVEAGDTVLVEYTVGDVEKSCITEIRRITANSNKQNSDHVVVPVTSKSADLFVVTGVYSGNDRMYYINVTAKDDKDNFTLSFHTVDGTDSGSAVVPYDGTVKLANSGLDLTLRGTEGLTVGSCYRVNVTSGASTAKSVIHVDKEIDTNATNIKVYFGKFRKFYLPNAQFTQNADGVSLNGAIYISGGIEIPGDCRVISGTVFMEYRSISHEYSNNIGYITSDTISKVGHIGLDNPMGAMVSVALKGGKGVYCLSVTSDSVQAYNKAFSLLSRSTTAYAIVLGTLREDIITAADMFVTSMAQASVANYKILYYGLDATNEVVIMDSNIVNNKVEPLIASVVNGVLTIENTTIADNFYTKDITTGDIIRIGYSVDKFGVESYDSLRVVEVLSASTVKVDDVTYDIPATTPLKFKVYRELEGSELVDDLKKRVVTNNHRSYCVFGDGITVDGIKNAPAWLLAALPAGMRAGEYCQRPISNLQYSRCTADNKLMLGSEDLKSLASRGVWILANTLDGNTVYNYHQLSTDMSDKKKQEQSYTTNFDNISREARALLAPYYGNSNISEDFLQQLNTELRAFLGGKTTNAPSTEIGPQLIKFENLVLIQDQTNLDHVDMEVDYYMPAPFNHVKLRQRLI